MSVKPVEAAAPVAATPPAKLVQKAEEFEGVFLGQLAKTMLETVEEGEMSGGHGEAMFRGVLAETMGTEMARQGGIGLAPAVLEQLLKMGEGR